LSKEQSIIEAVKNGDVSQYEVLVKKHSTKMFALAMSILHNQEDAEEVTQDVFLKAYQALDSFRGASKFSSFLYRICYNESMNLLRKRKIEFDVSSDQIANTVINDDFFEYKKLEQKEILDLAMQKLNPEYSSLLMFVYYEELSYNEIVEITNLSLSNVKVKIHRAKSILANVLNDLLKNDLNDLL